MERIGSMSNTEQRRRPAGFESEAKSRKGSGSENRSRGSGAGRAAASRASGGARKSGSGAAGAKNAVSSGARKAATGGTKRASSSSKKGMKTQTNAKKRKNTIQENPVARRSSAAFYANDGAPRRPAPPRSRGAQRSPKKGKRRRRRSGFSGVSAFLLMIVLALVGVGVWRMQEYRALAEMKAVVSRQTFYDGTSVDGVNVSGMTLQQALKYWEQEVEPAYRQAAAVLDDGTQVTAEQLGYASNYAQVLSIAWNAGRSGSLVERYRHIEAASAQPTAYEVNRTLYDDALVRQYAADVAAQIDTQPQDARLKMFNTETYSFEFEPEQSGRVLDQDALTADVEAALSAGGGSVNLQIETIAPEVTQENVAAQYGMISYAVTNASSSSSNRLSNIRLVLSMINGICLEPGESFSFNQTVGQRTTERGFKTATAYSGGKVTEEVGGGICQVSTTLFNAVVKADLKVDERHSHSLTVSYVDLGKDAAVDWGNKDLRFTNTSSDRVYICCYLTEDKRVRVGVFGKLLEDGVSITLEGVKTGTIDYNTEYQMNFTLFTGQTRVTQNGKKGYTATTYKIWWDANGNELRRSELCKSTYQATPEIIEYGP